MSLGVSVKNTTKELCEIMAEPMRQDIFSSFRVIFHMLLQSLFA